MRADWLPDRLLADVAVTTVAEKEVILLEVELDDAPSVKVDVGPQTARRLLAEANPSFLRALALHLDLVPSPVDIGDFDRR
jgi:hypothetical protein